MKKFKNLLLLSSTFATLATSVAISASCSSGKTTSSNEDGSSNGSHNTSLENGAASTSTDSNDNSGAKVKKPGFYINKNERVSLIHTDDQFDASKITDSKNKSMVVIADSGRIKDRSFNQSTWEALLQIYDQSGETTYIDAIEQAKYDQAYQNALAQGKKVWVLSGFGHETAIKTFLRSNGKRLEESGVTIISVDFPKPEDKYLHGFTRFYSLQYYVQEAAWIAGYATSLYLAYKFPAQTAENRKVGLIGGAPFNAVTDFMTGFYRGMAAYNKEHADKKVSTNKNSVPLNTGFAPDSTMSSAIENMLNSEKPNVVLPVAGPATDKLADLLKTRNENDTKIIGVDVDQGLANPANTERFITSITKGIGQSVYETILRHVFAVEPKNLKGVESDNGKYKLGYQQKWVDISEPHLKDKKDNTEMKKFIEEAIQKFNALTKEDRDLLISNKATQSGGDLEQDKLVEELRKEVNK